MRASLLGALAIGTAASIWGVSAIYFTLLDANALEIVAHRTFWSLIFFLIILAVQGRMAEFAAVLRNWRRLGPVIAGAVMVATNWLLFVYAVQIGRATEASIGYFILPLITAALGAVVLKERFNGLQRVAFGFAAVAVLVLTWGLGAAPWIGLLLAGTFAVYSLIKKQLDIGPVMSVAIEVALVGPALLAWVFWQSGGLGQFGASVGHAAWFIGLVGFTGFPLMLFAYGSKRMPLASAGLVTYINPTMQFLVAAVYFSEPLGWPHMIAMPLIWIGLALHSINAFRQERARRALIRAGTSVTVS